MLNGGGFIVGENQPLVGGPLSQLILALIVLLFCIKNVMDVNWDWIQILAEDRGGGGRKDRKWKGKDEEEEERKDFFLLPLLLLLLLPLLLAVALVEPLLGHCRALAGPRLASFGYIRMHIGSELKQ